MPITLCASLCWQNSGPTVFPIPPILSCMHALVKTLCEPGTVAYVCNSSYLGGRDGESWFEASPGK
jgi:hypothetical protein